jgi:4-hydroxybenzoyl-CoA reductase beta subunit
MRIQPFIYLEPKTLKEALIMLDENKEKLKIISGGTETVPLMKLRLIKPQYVMSLKRLSNLKGIREQNGKVIIGATTTLTEIIESPLMNSSFKGIVEAASSVAAPQIQNIATVAGNILQGTRCLFYNQSEVVRGGLEPCFKLKGHLCRAVQGAKRCFSVYQGDLAPILIAYKAKAKLERKGGGRTVAVSDLFTGNGKQPINIEGVEILTRIILPLPKNKMTGSSYKKLRIRGSIDYPLASAASVVYSDEKGSFVDVCVVIGAAGPSPKIVPITSLAKGKELSIEYIDNVAQAAYKVAETVNNQVLPGLYRRKVIKVLTKRALDNSLRDIHGGR